MPEEIENHIRNIQSKLQTLLKRHIFLKKENQKLLAANEVFSETNKELKQKVALLELQMNILKTSAGTLENMEKLNFEKTINEYIKTVDKCILILNK